MEVVLLCQRPCVFCVCLEVQVVVLGFVLMHVGALVVDDGLTSHIVVVSTLAVPVSHCVVYLVVEVDVGHPVLYWLQCKSNLMVDDISLGSVCSAGLEAQCR